MADQKLRCDHCGRPVAVIEGDELVIEGRHHGREHVTRIPLDKVRALALADGDPAPPIRRAS